MDKNLKKTIIILAGIVVGVLILVFPITKTYPDGGTVIKSALTYKKIKWNVRHGYNNTYTKGEEIYYFPKNFKSYEDYYKPEETVKLNYESKPIWIYISAADGSEAHKITNSELMTEIMTPLNSATYTYEAKAEDGEAGVAISIGNIERDTVNLEVKDSHTVILDGYLYKSDIELPYALLMEIFADN